MSERKFQKIGTDPIPPTMSYFLDNKDIDRLVRDLPVSDTKVWLFKKLRKNYIENLSDILNPGVEYPLLSITCRSIPQFSFWVHPIKKEWRVNALDSFWEQAAKQIVGWCSAERYPGWYVMDHRLELLYRTGTDLLRVVEFESDKIVT